MAAHSGPPDSDEIEVTLLGRGEGESCLVHVGNGDWLIVDSFIEKVPTTKTVGRRTRTGTRDVPAALVYLRDLYQGTLPTVRAVVLTHFHKDHYLGIVEVHKQFPTAMFVVPDAVSQSKFMQSMDKKSTKELRALGKHIERTGKPGRVPTKPSVLHKVSVAYTLITDVGDGVEVVVMAPSNDAKNVAADAIASIAAGAPATEYERILNDENTTSIALHVTACDTHVMLGGDVVNAPKIHGWPAVMAHPFNTTRAPAELVKVPHHGSHEAHHDPVWTDLVVDRSPAFVAPFWNKTIPGRTDQDRLVALGPLFQTGPSSTQWSTEWQPVVTANTPQTGRITARRKTGAAWTFSVAGTGQQVPPPQLPVPPTT